MFATWGAFITAFGILLLGVARTLSDDPTHVLRWATALAVLVAFSRFLWSNIVLGSDFLGFIAPLCLFVVVAAIVLVFSSSQGSVAPSSDANDGAITVTRKYPFA